MPRQVDFKVPKVECTEGEEIPYTELVDVEKTQMTTKMACEVSRNVAELVMAPSPLLVLLLTAGEEDDVLQAGGLDQVRQHRVPGVHGRTGRGVPRAGDDDTDAGLRMGLIFTGFVSQLFYDVAGEAAQEEVPPAGRLRAQVRQARRAGPRGTETGTQSQIAYCAPRNYFLDILILDFWCMKYR